MKLAVIIAATAVMVSAAMASDPASGTRPAILPAASQAAAIPDASELAQWIAQLNADDYATREAATKCLAELPAEALPTLKKAFAAKTLEPEAEARAAGILLALRSKIKMKFDFVATPLDTILRQMTQEYELVVLQRPVMSQKVTVQNPRPLDAKSGIILLNDMLFQLGYMAVTTTTRDGQMALSILSQQEARRMQIPVFQGADAEQIPLNDDLRTQIIPLQNIAAAALRNDLMPLIGDDVAMAKDSNALVITDTSAKIHRLVQIIQKLDVPQNKDEKAPATQPAGH